MTLMRIKTKDIPALRDSIANTQQGLCRLCRTPLASTSRPCLDHDHKTGLIRGVLCLNCNGIEGKIHNLARRAKRGPENSVRDFLVSVIEYWDFFLINPRKEIHPTHKTDEEKRVLRNKKARLRRVRKTK